MTHRPWPLKRILWLPVILTSLAFRPADLEIEAVSLSKADLPDDFPFQMLTRDFAILHVTIHNPTAEPASFQLDALTVMTPRNKRVKRALSTDITPQVMRFYRGQQRGVHGELYSGRRRPYPGEMERAPTIEPGRSSGTVAADTASQLRAILEHYELTEGVLEPGTSREGYLYLKSKKHGRQLSRYQVRFGQATISIP